MFGYKCTLQTDTEVITYTADCLLRKQGLSLEEAASVIAAPFWSTIGLMLRGLGLTGKELEILGISHAGE